MGYNAWSVNLLGLFSLLTKEIRRFFRIWPQTLLPPVVNMGLYFIVFGQWLGTGLNKIQGYPYIAYLIPGLVFMSMVTNAYANVVSSFFLARFQRQIEELLVASLEDVFILVGYVLAGALRGLIVAALVLLFSKLFFDWQMAHPFVFASMSLMAVLIFALAGFINGLFAKKFDDINVVPVFILGPLNYLGGVFYDISALPEKWRSLCVFNPIYHLVKGLRWAFLGDAFACDYPLILLGMLVVLIALFCWAYALMCQGKGLRY